MLISKKKKKFNPRVNIRKMQRTLKLVNYSNNNGRMINVHRVNPFNIINWIRETMIQTNCNKQ